MAKKHLHEPNRDDEREFKEWMHKRYGHIEGLETGQQQTMVHNVSREAWYAARGLELPTEAPKCDD